MLWNWRIVVQECKKAKPITQKVFWDLAWSAAETKMVTISTVLWPWSVLHSKSCQPVIILPGDWFLTRFVWLLSSRNPTTSSYFHQPNRCRLFKWLSYLGKIEMGSWLTYFETETTSTYSRPTFYYQGAHTKLHPENLCRNQPKIDKHWRFSLWMATPKFI